MLVISPWTRGGWVSSEVFDHTSVHALPGELDRRPRQAGQLPEHQRLAPQGAAATSPASSTSRTRSTECPPCPPPRGDRPDAPAARCPTPRRQTTRCPRRSPAPARPAPLPYQPNGNLDRLEFGAAGKILAWFSMTNQGAAAKRAAHFAVHPNAYRTGGPGSTRSTRAARRPTSSTSARGSATGKYDITMVGPNRFLRRFTGDATKARQGLEVAARFAVEPRHRQAGDLVQADQRLRGRGEVHHHARTTTAPTAPGPTPSPADGSAEDYFNAVALQNGWYDFTVTADVGPHLVAAVHRPHRDRRRQRQRLRLRAGGQVLEAHDAEQLQPLVGLGPRPCRVHHQDLALLGDGQHLAVQFQQADHRVDEPLDRRTPDRHLMLVPQRGELRAGEAEFGDESGRSGIVGAGPEHCPQLGHMGARVRLTVLGGSDRPDPWHGVVSTVRIRDELGFRPLYPSVWAARDAGAL